MSHANLLSLLLGAEAAATVLALVLVLVCRWAGRGPEGPAAH